MKMGRSRVDKNVTDVTHPRVQSARVWLFLVILGGVSLSLSLRGGTYGTWPVAVTGELLAAALLVFAITASLPAAWLERAGIAAPVWAVAKVPHFLIYSASNYWTASQKFEHVTPTWTEVFRPAASHVVPSLLVLGLPLVLAYGLGKSWLARGRQP